ncbi:MAG: channel protein, hemolysin family [Deltaproteobacteria bacterium]|nr:channel protein, hemolysin family [Deltaproteobacteria bacterium]
MTQTSASRERTQSPGEETANSVSHAVGLAAALAAAPVLVLSAVRDGGAARIAGASVFAAAMVLLYLTSTLYHALPMNRAKRVFQVLDHAAIFLMIAGTYTPFTLGVLRGTWGWTLFGLIWALALAGVVLTAAGGVRYPKLTTALYLGMGWLILVAVKPLWLRMPSEGLFWLLAGGIAYTVGVVFYAAKRVRYCHFVWHLFVIAGTTCHFIAVLRFAG